MVQVYRVALRLYPADFRRAFGAAMVASFADAMTTASAPLGRVAFFTRELGGVIAGAGREWLSTATAAPFERQMTFRDPSLMRPPGMTRHEWGSRL
jgi:hypothetical protein